MVTNIIRVGNSKGVIIPAEILQKLHLSLKSAVDISVVGDVIQIKGEPRQGWAAAAEKANETGDDTLIIQDVFDDERKDDWEW